MSNRTSRKRTVTNPSDSSSQSSSGMKRSLNRKIFITRNKATNHKKNSKKNKQLMSRSVPSTSKKMLGKAKQTTHQKKKPINNSPKHKRKVMAIYGANGTKTYIHG